MSIRINNKIIAGTYTAQSYRYVGEIFQSALPIDDTRVALLDGHKIYDSEGYGSFIQYIISLSLLYPQLACTENEWQTYNTTYGECGKFVIGEDGSVRLPKIVSFVQGLSSLQDLATLVEAGLPNITGTFDYGQINGGGSYSASGAFTATKQDSNTGYGSNSYDCPRISFDASRSSSIYGNSNTVQPQSIRYPYYIVLATGVTQEVKVKEELSTNNPFTLFESKYSEVELNNTSWLLSSGQWNSKELYPSAYNELVKNVNNGEAHFVSNKMYYFTNTGEPALTYVITTEKAKVGQAVYGLSTGFKNYIEEVTENGFKFTDPNYGYLEFVYSPNLNNSNTYNPTDYDFVLNTADETFRLPIKTSERVLFATKKATSSDYTEYNLYSDGWFEFTTQIRVSGSIAGNHTISLPFTMKDTNYSVVGSLNHNNSSDTSDKNIYEDWSQRTVDKFQIHSSAGLKGFTVRVTGYAVEPKMSNYTKNIKLYYYVGETNINTNLINVGKLTQEVAELKSKTHLVESYTNGTSWYRVYSDRWCEQGGTVIHNAVGSYTITYLKPMADTNYTAFISVIDGYSDDTGGLGETPSISGKTDGSYPYGKTKTQLRISCYSGDKKGFSWEVKGYIA